MSTDQPETKPSLFKTILLGGFVGLFTSFAGGVVGAIAASMIAPAFGCAFTITTWLIGCFIVAPVAGVISGGVGSLIARRLGRRPVLYSAALSFLVGLLTGIFVSRVGIPVGC